MVDIIALRQERGEHLTTLEAMIAKAEAERRDLTKAEAEDYERRKGAMAALAARIARAEELERDITDRARPIDGNGAVASPSRGPLFVDTATGRTIRGLARDEKLVNSPDRAIGPAMTVADFGRAAQAAATGRWSALAPEIRAAMQEGVNTGGGFLVPDQLSRQVIDLARNASVTVAAGAITVPMESDHMILAKVVADPTAVWIGENVAIGDSDISFGAVTLTARKLAVLVKASNEVVSDAQNLGDLLVRSISAAVALEFDRAAMYGVAPAINGFRDHADLNQVSMGTNGAAADDYSEPVDALQKLWAANVAVDAPLVAVMAPRTAAAFAKLEDSTGQPLRAPAVWELVRKLVSNQVPVNLTQGSSNVASDILVGDWSNLLIGVRMETRVEVSREAGTAFGDDQTWFRAILRADTVLTRASHMCRIVGIL